MKEKRSSESSDCSGSCTSSPAEIEPTATENMDVIQATASSSTEVIFIPQFVAPQYNATNLEIPQPSQFSPQTSEDATQYQFPDYQFNSRYINSYLSPEGRAFFYDASVYPTEYYPTGFESYEYNPYAQHESWLDNYDMSYLN